MNNSESKTISIVGAGLAGSLLAVELARRGVEVDVFERNPDPRSNRVPAGRSINLALAERGRAALHKAGLLDHIERFSLPMAGRMLHDREGQTQLQPYGQHDDEVIWSVHRGELNKALLTAAEAAGVNIRFGHTLDGVDFEARQMHFTDTEGDAHQLPFQLAIGADGAGSALRRAMQKVTAIEAREEPLGHGYCELTIPPGPDGDFQMVPEALHIWPRGGFMMIALPNPDRSFTCTLFLARESTTPEQPSFAGLQDPAQMQAFLATQFPDAVRLMPELEREIREHPIGYLATLYVDRWHFRDQALLIGDAAHAIVPFHGQGMNAAFEDVSELVDRLATEAPDEAMLERFARERKPNADAIAAMALDNYLEMRDRVRDPRFQLMKELAWALESRLGDGFIPRYQMIMFHPEIPYADALRRGNRQRALLESLTECHSTLDEIDLNAACEQARALDLA